MKPGKTAPQNLWRVFGAPLVLGILSAMGLTAALLGDGFWDAVSWLTLGIPIAVIGFFVWWKG